MASFEELFGLIDQKDKALRRNRRADFGLTNNINDALYGNLSGFIAGRRGKLSAENVRILGRMDALVKAMKAAGRVTVAAEKGATDRYGGMLANAASFAYAPARQAAAAGTEVAQAGRRLGGDYAATGADIMGIAAQGASQARAGADYATAQALSERGQKDAADIANEKLQLKMLELQQQFEMQKMDKQFQYEQKLKDLEEKKLEDQAGPIAALGMKNALTLGTEAMFKVRDYIQAHPDMKPDELLAGMQEEGVIPGDEYSVSLARQLIGDPTLLQDLRKHRSSARQKAGTMVDVFLSAHPEFLSFRANLIDIAYRHIRQAENMRVRQGGVSSDGGGGIRNPFTTKFNSFGDAVRNLASLFGPPNIPN